MKTSKEFVYLFLMTEYILRIYKSKFSEKGLQPNLKKEDVVNLAFPLPPLSEQLYIVSKVEELMKKCDELEVGIKQSQTYTNQLMQSVLQDALNPGGKIH